jgi:hypothetical protein
MAEQSSKTKTGNETVGGGKTGTGAGHADTGAVHTGAGSTGMGTGMGSSGAGSTGTGGAGSTSQMMGGLRDKVASAADAQKNRAADGLGSIADVARRTSDELRGESEMLASWVNVASDQLRLMADRLRDRRPGELADDLTRFARERPAMFLGGAFLLGLGVARLLKSSAPPAWDQGDGNGRQTARDREFDVASANAPSSSGQPGGTWTPSTGAY